MIAIVCGSMCGIGAFLILRFTVTEPTANLGGPLNRRLLNRSQVDRRILDIPDAVLVARLMTGAVAGATCSLAVVFALAKAGVGIPPVVALVVVGSGLSLPAVATLDRIKKEAAGARRTFSYALSSYLDLASVLLAGGAGSETALSAASSTGSSWSFLLIREALETARAGRVPSWRAFGELGTKYGIVDLERLGGSMQLAGEQGAKVRISLAAQAEALRSRQIAEIEAEAQAATERMGIPTVLLFVGFIALLGYPALNLVVGQM